MHIIFHTQYYPPEIGAPQARLHELAKGLIRRGIQVTVLTAMPNYPGGRILDGYRKPFMSEDIDGVHVVRCAIYPSQSARMLPRLLSYLSFMLSSLLIGGSKLGKADFLLTESPPLFLGITGWLLSVWKGARWIFNVSDLWPESVAELGLISRQNLSFRLGSLLERFLYRKAWTVTAPARSILESIRSRFPDVLTHHLPNGVDTALFKPDENRETKDEIQIMYAGLHGLAQGLDQILQAAKVLESVPNLSFTLIGDGPEKSQLVQSAHSLGLNRIHFLEPVSKREIPSLLQNADILIVPLKIQLTGAVPSKLYEAMAMRKPVILIASSEAADIVNNAGCGLIVNPGDIDGLVNAITRLANDPEARLRMGENGREAAVRSHDRRQISDQFARFLMDARDNSEGQPGKYSLPFLRIFTPRNSSLLAKRLFDILASLLGMLILLPFLGLVALKMRRESPGPIFFHGLRMGRNGRPFRILKFRTMYEQTGGHNGPCITARDDCRITPMGRWLRDTKLNELPQLWNVFKGEMSIVGPRPEDVDIARAWPDGVREEILSVRPGITSPASVIYRDEEKLLHTANVMDEYLQTVLPQKLRLDQLYVRNRNFLGDLDVILATLAALLPQLRESQFSAEALYNGHLSRLVRRYISWYVIDSLVAFGAISVAALLWRIERPLDLGWFHSGMIAGAMALIFSLVNSLRGLGRLSWHSARPAYAFDIFLSSALTTTFLAAVNWFWIDRPVFPRGMVFVAGLLAFLGFLMMRYRERLLTGLAWRWLSHREGESVLGERVLIVGAGDCGMLALWLLAHSRLSNLFKVVGMVDDNPSKAGMTVDGLPVLGLTRRIPELVKQKDIGVILFAIERIHPQEQARIMDLCRGTGARLVMVPDLMEMFRERMVHDDAVRPANPVPTVETRVSGPAPALRELGAVRGESPEAG